MAKFKAYDYRQRVFLPVSLEDQLMPGTLEFAIHTLVETRLDTSAFEQKYRNDETGRTAYDPKILVKMVLLGYARGLISSRKIEQACRENVVFVALGCGQQPDHSTIAALVSSMKGEILPLFRDVLLVCQEMGLDAYIPDRYFRRRDPRYAAQRRYWPRRKRFALEDFHYEEATDHYLCPQGKRLRRIAKKAYGDGLVRRIYVAEEQDCQRCPLHLRCLTARGGKRRYLRVPIGVELTNFSQRMAGKVDSELGRKIYPQRFAVAEPVFANIRTHTRLDRFTLRGKVKVNIQWLLYCMIHNIEKIANYGFT